MIYIGFVITVEEALRLLGLDKSMVTSSYDTKPIQDYLREKGSQVTFSYIDKGACAFGLPVTNNYSETYQTLDDCILGLQSKQREFREEIEKLKVDTSEVNLVWSESKEKPVKNPEGYLIDI